MILYVNTKKQPPTVSESLNAKTDADGVLQAYSSSFGSAVSSFRFKRGSTVPLECVFADAALAESVAKLRFGLKLAGRFDDLLVVAAETDAKTLNTDGTVSFALKLTFDAAAIDAALNVNASAADDLATAAFVAEIEWENADGFDFREGDFALDRHFSELGGGLVRVGCADGRPDVHALGGEHVEKSGFETSGRLGFDEIFDELVDVSSEPGGDVVEGVRPFADGFGGFEHGGELSGGGGERLEGGGSVRGGFAELVGEAARGFEPADERGEPNGDVFEARRLRPSAGEELSESARAVECHGKVGHDLRDGGEFFDCRLCGLRNGYADLRGRRRNEIRRFFDSRGKGLKLSGRFTKSLSHIGKRFGGFGGRQRGIF